MINRYLLNISVFFMSAVAFSATVELAPSTLPIGATDSTAFVQAVTITLQNNGFELSDVYS